MFSYNITFVGKIIITTIYNYYGGKIIMATRKTQFVVNFKADVAMVNQLITNWLNVNKYVLKEKYNTRYYQTGDGVWTTAECFEYYFNGNQVIIYGYLKSPKKPVPLDNAGRASANSPYMKRITQLIALIEELSQTASPYAQQQGYAQESQLRRMEMINNTMVAEADKKGLLLSIGALVCGILNIIILFRGYVLWYLVAVGIALSVEGLKSRNKLISISALVLTGLVILTFVLVKAGVVYL